MIHNDSLVALHKLTMLLKLKRPNQSVYFVGKNEIIKGDSLTKFCEQRTQRFNLTCLCKMRFVVQMVQRSQNLNFLE